MKLHPGVVYSHAASQVCTHPVLTGCRTAVSTISAPLRPLCSSLSSGRLDSSTSPSTSASSSSSSSSSPHVVHNPPSSSSTSNNTSSNTPCLPLNLPDAITHLEYELSGSKGDWRYAMDLCAGLYRFRDIRYSTCS